MKRITNTQYLKTGDKTNVGTVKAIHDNKSFLSSDGFSYHLTDWEIYKTESVKRCVTHHQN